MEISSPGRTSGEAPRSKSAITYVASLIIKATPGNLLRLKGYNSGAAQFLQLYDSATLPADTAVPVFLMAIAATANFDIDFTPYGRYFVNGIVVGNSSTGPTKTIGAANCAFDAQYV